MEFWVLVFGEFLGWVLTASWLVPVVTAAVIVAVATVGWFILLFAPK